MGKKIKRRGKDKGPRRCKHSLPCKNGCVPLSKQCRSRPPYKCKFNKVLYAKDETVVLKAKCHGKSRVIRYSSYDPYKKTGIDTLLKLQHDPVCKKFVVPARRVVISKGIRPQQILVGGGKALRGERNKDAREEIKKIARRGKLRQLIVMPYYNSFTKLSIDKRKKLKWANNYTPKQMLLDYVQQCSHPTGYLHGDMYARNIVYKRTFGKDDPHVHSPRLIDWDDVEKIETNPVQRRGQMIITLDRIQNGGGV